MKGKRNGEKKGGSDDSQYQKFLQAAKEHGCDESGDRYEAIVKKVAEQPPQPRKPKKGKRNG